MDKPAAPHKKYDPQMHTTEHILSRTMKNLFNADQIEMHLEKKKSKTDYTFDHNLTQEEKQTIENKVNEIITKKVPVEISIIPRAEVPSSVNLSKLPPSADKEETVRIIKIGDPQDPYDIQPCIGEHVSNTSEIKGLFKITTFTFEGNTLRLRWTIK